MQFLSLVTNSHKKKEEMLEWSKRTIGGAVGVGGRVKELR